MALRGGAGPPQSVPLIDYVIFSYRCLLQVYNTANAVSPILDNIRIQASCDLCRNSAEKIDPNPSRPQQSVPAYRDSSWPL